MYEKNMPIFFRKRRQVFRKTRACFFIFCKKSGDITCLFNTKNCNQWMNIGHFLLKNETNQVITLRDNNTSIS